MKLLTPSILILLALYGLVFAIGDLYLAQVGIPLWGAIAFAVVFIGIQYVIGPWLVEKMVEIQWDDLIPRYRPETASSSRNYARNED